MRKNLLILLLTSALTAAMLVGCSGEKKQETADSLSEVTEETPEENKSENMVNPMVEVTDADELADNGEHRFRESPRWDIQCGYNEYKDR